MRVVENVTLLWERVKCHAAISSLVARGCQRRFQFAGKGKGIRDDGNATAGDCEARRANSDRERTVALPVFE